jgi:hypothetical protein
VTGANSKTAIKYSHRQEPSAQDALLRYIMINLSYHRTALRADPKTTTLSHLPRMSI